MKALVLAAGYATRLYPLTKEYPKPLLTVKTRPIINYILDKIKEIQDIDEIMVVTNSKFISRFRAWKRSLSSNKKITLIDDLTKDNSRRLGAIGDMEFAIKKKHIRDDLLVIGGDNLFDGSLKDFIYFTKSKMDSPVIGAFDIKNKLQAGKYGVLKLGKANRIIDFQEKPNKPKSSLVAMCLYYFPKTKLKLIQEYRKDKVKKSDATGFYIDWLRKKLPVYGFVFKGKWFDIGDRKFYEKANQAFVQ